MSSVRSNVAFLMPQDPLRGQGYQDTVRAIRPDNDPEKPPAKEPGDSNLVGLTLIGLVAGGALGFLVASMIVGPSSWLLCAVVGGLVGGVIGAFIGDAINKRRYRREE
jgi:hypothetical protein